MTKIGFIGAGQMARALARGFAAAKKVAAQEVRFYDPSSAAVDAFQAEIKFTQACDAVDAVVADSDVIFLAVKPQHMDSVFAQLVTSSASLFVSIAAGVTLDRLAAGLKSERVIRVMPNTPCLVGAGAAGFCRGAGASDQDAQLVSELLSSLGVAYELPEELLDAVTGLSGSGPAFVYLMIEAMSDGGVRMGLPRKVAAHLAAQTVLGAAQMVLETGEHPGVLKDRVASPGGTTIAGLHALESGGFRATLMDAVKAATERSRELG